MEQEPIQNTSEIKNGTGKALLVVIILVLILATVFFFVSSDRMEEVIPVAETEEPMEPERTVKVPDFPEERERNALEVEENDATEVDVSTLMVE